MATMLCLLCYLAAYHSCHSIAAIGPGPVGVLPYQTPSSSGCKFAFQHHRLTTASRNTVKAPTPERLCNVMHSAVRMQCHKQSSIIWALTGSPVGCSSPA